MTLWLSSVLVPMAAAGTLAGKYLVQALSEKWFYLSVQIVLFLVSVKLVFNGMSAVLA